MPPIAKTLEASKQHEDNTNVGSVMVGTHDLKLKGPVVVDETANSSKAILTIQSKPSSNDHEASTSKAKPRDTKYTQPKWCPPGLTKTKKRRLQRMRNQEKVEQEAEKWRDEFFDEIHPIPSHPIQEVETQAGEGYHKVYDNHSSTHTFHISSYAA
jgi:hypothetical protein